MGIFGLGFKPHHVSSGTKDSLQSDLVRSVIVDQKT